MIRKLSFLMISILLAATLSPVAMAQRPNQNRGVARAAVPPAESVTIEGIVEAVNLGYGMGMPSFTLGSGNSEVTVVLGPYRILTAKNFQIKQGDQVSVQAVRSPRGENTYAALEVTNVSTRVKTVLRDATDMGFGAGFGRRGFGGYGAGACLRAGEPQLDLAGKTSFDGKVESVNMGPQQGFPNITLIRGDGKTVLVVAAPFRALLDAQFKMAVGDALAVVAYPSKVHENAYVAAEINNLTNKTSIVLRDENGIPLGGGMGRGGCLLRQ
jgi:hypothetical protein